MARGGGREPGTWMCRECRRYNRPTMDSCRECGASKPTKPKPKPRRTSKPRVTERSKEKRAAEKESGLGSNGVPKTATAEQRKRARGRALMGSPVANRIERGVRERLERDREEEERASA